MEVSQSLKDRGHGLPMGYRTFVDWLGIIRSGFISDYELSDSRETVFNQLVLVQYFMRWIF